MSEFNHKPDSFREAVCVEAQRIYDSCSDKDCLTDLPVTLDAGVTIPTGTTIVKCRCAEIYDVCIAVECVPFNKGFYAVDITYKFKLTLDAYTEPCFVPTTLTGTTVFTKKVILFGSEGNSKTFSSKYNKPFVQSTSCCCCSETLPIATVQVVNPIALEARLVCCHHSCSCETTSPSAPRIVVTLGVFSIIQLTRKVSMLIPVYDFCIPSKDCTTNSDSACEIFDKISFPTDEFFPPAIEKESDSGCGCCK